MTVTFRTHSTDELVAGLKTVNVTALDLATSGVKLFVTTHSSAIKGLDLATQELPQPITFGDALRSLRGPQTLKVFDIFPRLPQEIQDKIWVNAILANCEPRIIKVREIEDPEQHDTQGNVIPGRGSRYEAEGDCVPQWLRRAGRHITNLALSEGIYEPLRIIGCRLCPYFRPELDIIQMSTTRDARSSAVQLRLCDVVENPKIPNQQRVVSGNMHIDLLFHAGRMDEKPGKPITKLAYLEKDHKILNPGFFSRIRHLQIEAQTILSPGGCDFNWLAGNLRSMPNLLTMSFDTDITLLPGQRAPNTYCMEYEPNTNTTTPGSHYLPVHHDNVNSVTLRGQLAINHMFSAISDRVEYGRYWNMHNMMEVLHLGVRYMPVHISMVTEYHVLDFGNDFSSFFSDDDEHDNEENSKEGAEENSEKNSEEEHEEALD